MLVFQIAARANAAALRMASLTARGIVRGTALAARGVARGTAVVGRGAGRFNMMKHLIVVKLKMLAMKPGIMKDYVFYYADGYDSDSVEKHVLKLNDKELGLETLRQHADVEQEAEERLMFREVSHSPMKTAAIGLAAAALFAPVKQKTSITLGLISIQIFAAEAMLTKVEDSQYLANRGYYTMLLKVGKFLRELTLNPEKSKYETLAMLTAIEWKTGQNAYNNDEIRELCREVGIDWSLIRNSHKAFYL